MRDPGDKESTRWREREDRKLEGSPVVAPEERESQVRDPGEKGSTRRRERERERETDA